MANKNEAWTKVSRDRVRASWHMKNADTCIRKLVEEYQLLGSEEVGALKASMEGSFRMLNKVLPDLKHTDATVTHQGKVDFKWNP